MNNQPQNRRPIFQTAAACAIASACLLAVPVAPASAAEKTGGAIKSDENMVFPAEVVINIKETCGAVGDGKTDDTAAIQAAVEKYKGSNSTLYFPNGTYLISDSVGIFNGKAHSRDRFLSWQGQSEAGAIIKLKDNSDGFGDARKFKTVVSTYQGQGTGDVMHTYVRDLTVDVGAGNPGAAGLRFMSNNVGAVNHVTIRSSDPEHVGYVGLDLSQGQNGPCLIKNVTVDGFDRGATTGDTFSLVLEHITMRNQRTVGFENKSARTTIRDLRSENKVPAITNGGAGELTVIGGNFTGGSADASAIVTEGAKVFLRDIKQTGYGHILTDAAKKNHDGESLDEWAGMATYAPVSGTAKSLRLPIEETPEVPWETDLSKWYVVEKKGGKKDITESLQKAIDEGAEKGLTTICFPPGEKYAFLSGPIRIHGSINRIIGMTSIIDVVDPNGVFKKGASLFTFEDLKSDALVIERFFILGGWDGPSYVNMLENKSGKTIILKDVGLSGQTKKPDPGGKWFIEDISPSRQSTLRVGKGETMWIRQWNPESPAADMTHVDGGTLWVLGLKTEGRSTQIKAENNAKVEVLGGVVYQSWEKQGLNPPAFIVNDSQASFTVGFYHHKDPFKTIVSETQGGTTKTLERDDLKGYFMALYRAGK